MKQSHSWAANSFWASKEIFQFLWSPNIHYRVHKSSPFVHNVSQINPVHTLSFLFMIILTPISKSLNYMHITEAAVMGSSSLVVVTVARIFIELSSRETCRPIAICFVLGSVCFRSEILYCFPLFHVGCYMQFFFFSFFHGKWLLVNVVFSL